MRADIREAIEDACESQIADREFNWSASGRPISFDRASDLIRRFAQNIPDHMTIAELCDELCHADNQGGAS